MHTKQNFIKIHLLFLKISRKIGILTSVKGHNSVEKFGKISCFSHNTAYTQFHQNQSICSQDTLMEIKFWHQSRAITRSKNNLYCPYLHFVNIHAFTKFYQYPSIGPQDIEHKRNFDINQGPKLCWKWRKMLFNHPNLQFVNINAYTKFDWNPQINWQDTEHK